MNPLFEATLSVLFTGAGVGLGFLFSRLRKPYWVIGYVVPLLLIIAYGLARHFPMLPFVPLVAWVMGGQKAFAIMGFIIAMILTTPLSRLPRKRDRQMVFVLMIVMAFAMTVWPFVAPFFSRSQLEHLQTRIDPNGICRQSTDYTCGPAAAVTALRKLGLPADEGKLAILSCTSSMTGTASDTLAETLRNEYGKDGLIVEYRMFKDVSELKQAGLTLAIVKFGFMVDHFVTVLEVTDSEVIVGDPLNGLNRMSHDEFCQKWRFEGIVLKRRVPFTASPSICVRNKAQT